jgi:hypothetical protein
VLRLWQLHIELAVEELKEEISVVVWRLGLSQTISNRAHLDARSWLESRDRLPAVLSD